MGAPGKPRRYGLVLGIFFLVLENQNQKRNLVIPFINDWIQLPVLEA